MSEETKYVIEVKNLTKDYGKGRGLFDISFKVPKGCVFGYCGTNGSGKTTTIRHIMGFIKPDKGEVYVNGMDAWKCSEEIKKLIGYVPGEIAFPDVNSGTDFLKIQAESLGLDNLDKASEVIKKLQLDPTANLKRMSKGMKQKTALVAAFMNEPEILILDEPTTGLDPLMRDAFVSLILEEKAKGRTIFMSSHMFEEMEETCDYVGLIKDGHLVDVIDMNQINHPNYRFYKIEFVDKKDYLTVKKSKFEITRDQEEFNQLTLKVDVGEYDKLFTYLKDKKIKYISEVKYTLKQYFEKIVEQKEN